MKRIARLDRASVVPLQGEASEALVAELRGLLSQRPIEQAMVRLDAEGAVAGNVAEEAERVVVTVNGGKGAVGVLVFGPRRRIEVVG